MALGAATEQDQVQILLTTQTTMDWAAMDHGTILEPGVDGAVSAEAVLLMATLMIGDIGMTHTMRTTLVQGETPFTSRIIDPI